MAVVAAILPASVLFQISLAAIYVVIVPLGGGLLIGWLIGLGRDT